MSDKEQDLQLVERYLTEHFAPIARRLAQRIPDREMRLIALRRTTRHIWHWQLDEERRRATVRTGGSNGGSDDNGAHTNGAESEVMSEGDEPVARRAAYAAARAEDRNPKEWVTGEEPATPKQLEVLRDRGIPHASGITKAEASLLITSVLAFRGVTA